MNSLPCSVLVSGKNLIRVTFFVGDSQYQVELDKIAQQDFRHVLTSLPTAGASVYNGEEGTVMFLLDGENVKLQFKFGGNYGNGKLPFQEVMGILEKFPASKEVA